MKKLQALVVLKTKFLKTFPFLFAASFRMTLEQAIWFVKALNRSAAMLFGLFLPSGLLQGHQT